MGPTKTVKSKHVSKGVNKPTSRQKPSGSSSSSSVKSKSKSKKGITLPPPRQQKTKSTSHTKKRSRPKYTDKELGIPTLNTIVPAGVEAPKRGKAKGAGSVGRKVYVDDAESMLTILAIVNADKEGQIESKMMKSRQMEEIREARLNEAAKREEGRKGKLENVKREVKREEKEKKSLKRSRGKPDEGPQQAKKRVAFA